MHPEIISDKPGQCPICHMDLIKKSEELTKEIQHQSKIRTFWPLIVIVSLITVTALTVEIKNTFYSGFDINNLMLNFMAGFFLVFSGFKLLDLKGFAMGYASYDLLARRIPKYGLIYPFLELSLGLAYLIKVEPMLYVNLATLTLMGFSGLGVLESVSKKRKFQCACLGTIIKVPLTGITLIEDFGMATMALYMLVLA